MSRNYFLFNLLLLFVAFAACQISYNSPNDYTNQYNQYGSSSYGNSSPDATGFMNGIWNPIWESAVNFASWLMSSEQYTTYDKSDLHDNQWSHAPSNAMASLFNSNNSWQDSIKDMAIAGREPFSMTNAMTIGYETMIQAASCFSFKTWSDPDLGTFGVDQEKYCDPKCGRLIPGLMCCAPMTPDILDIKLRLKVKGEDERLLNFRDPNDRLFLTGSSGRVVFIIHGWVEKMSIVHWITDMRDGFVDLNDSVIVVDWRRGNSVQYWQAVANTRVVGAMIGAAILNWGIADRTLVTGFSLGAQIAGEAGRFTKSRGGILINECHGLDPAGPFYDGTDQDILLTKNDSRLVQVLHTSAEDIRSLGFLAVRFGTYRKSGHCDYWINCGHSQGPCLDIDFNELIKAWARLAVMSDGEMMDFITSRACSHWRAPDVYVSSLKRLCDHKPLIAYPCPKCGDSHTCVDKKILMSNESKNSIENDRLPPLSRCTPDMDVNYYVSSDVIHPFCSRL